MMVLRLTFLLWFATCLLSVELVSSKASQQCEVEDDGTCRQEYDLAPKFQWDPDSHSCNIRRLTLKELILEFGRKGLTPLYHEPVVIYDTTGRNEKFQALCQRSQIVHNFPTDFHVTLSSSNSFSAHRRTVPFTQYLEEIETQRELSPDQLSNETWYLFGETFSHDWKAFLANYTLPPCVTCTDSLVALSFGIGNRGSGVQWHVHGPGFSESLVGRKHWVLYPPDQKPSYQPDHTSRHWMEYTYTKLSTTEQPYECTVAPGELIYFPNHWHHATINLDVYTAFVSSFTTEVGFDL